MTLLHVTAKAKCNDRDSLIDALKKLATIDDDFNGNNGEEYTRNTDGYSSDMDAAIAYVEDFEYEEKVVKEFVDLWFKDNSYYDKYDLVIEKADDILFISLTTLSAD